jgi:hypothetical protein
MGSARPPLEGFRRSAKASQAYERLYAHARARTHKPENTFGPLRIIGSRPYSRRDASGCGRWSASETAALSRGLRGR